jgi:hypothetical protein
VNRARNTGNFKQTKGVGGVPPEARSLQNEEAVLQGFEEDATLSIRSAASMFNISKSTTQLIPKDNRQHAYRYHYMCVQIFLLEDLPLRMYFCDWLLQQHEANPNICRKYFFVRHCQNVGEIGYKRFRFIKVIFPMVTVQVYEAFVFHLSFL